MHLTVIAPDRELDAEMVSTQSVDPLEIGDGIAVTWQVPVFKIAGVPRMIDVTLEISDAVPANDAASIIAAWIMNHFGRRAEAVAFTRQRIGFEEEKLQRLVHEAINQERGN